MKFETTKSKNICSNPTSSSILKEPQKALFLVRFRPVIKA